MVNLDRWASVINASRWSGLSAVASLPYSAQIPHDSCSNVQVAHHFVAYSKLFSAQHLATKSPWHAVRGSGWWWHYRQKRHHHSHNTTSHNPLPSLISSNPLRPNWPEHHGCLWLIKRVSHYVGISLVLESCWTPFRGFFILEIQIIKPPLG